VTRRWYSKDADMSDAGSHKGETGPSSPLKPEHVFGELAARLSIAPGWWAVDSVGTPILGPFPNQETTLLEIAIARRASTFMRSSPGDAS
jgi:hypothetical protein